MEKRDLIVLIFICAVALILFLVFFRRINITYIKIYYYFKHKFKLQDIYFKYTKSIEHSYSTEDFDVPISKDKLLKNFKKLCDCNFYIESKYKNNNYPFFDLDKPEHLETFKKLYYDTPYVIFRSSKDKYWAILDTPKKNIKEIFEMNNWLICNDSQYVAMSKSKKALCIRASYNNKSRRPRTITENGILSPDLKKFIKLLQEYYNNLGLEISVLKHKNHDMLVTFNRKQKLKELEKFII